MVLLEEWHIQLLDAADHDDGPDVTAVLVDTCNAEVNKIVARVRQRLTQALPGVPFELVVER